MKTKILTVFLFAFQLMGFADYCPASFKLISTNSYFDFNTRTGMVPVSVEALQQRDKSFMCTGGAWSTDCEAVTYSGKINFQLYLSSDNVLDGNDILVSTLLNVASNSRGSYTVQDNCFRTTWWQGWNDVFLNYSLPAGMSICTFNSTYRFAIVKMTYKGTQGDVIDSDYIATPSFPAPTFTTTTPQYCLLSANSAQVCINPVQAAVSYNWTYPSGWTGPATTTGTCITVNFNGIAQSGSICCSANMGCGPGPVACYLTSTVSAVPARPVFTSYTQIGPSCNFYPNVRSIAGAQTYNWSFSSNFSPSLGVTTTPYLYNDVDFYQNTLYRFYVRATNSCGTGATLTVSARTPSVPNCAARINQSENNEDTADQEWKSESISIYPNPVSQHVIIELPSSIIDKHVISLMDLTGRKIKSIIKTSEIGMNQYTIETEDLRAGIYLLSIETVEGILLKKEKLIVVH